MNKYRRHKKVVSTHSRVGWYTQERDVLGLSGFPAILNNRRFLPTRLPSGNRRVRIRLLIPDSMPPLLVLMFHLLPLMLLTLFFLWLLR